MGSGTAEVRLPRMPYTVAQVAEAVGKSKMTIYREIQSGRLRARKKRGCSKQLFITQEDLDAWAQTMLEDD